MKRLLFAFVVMALLAIAPAALAYDSIVGCTTDANGDPWTNGGTITCVRLGITVGSGSLGSDGCFQVYIGNGPSTTCTIDFTPGPAGDPMNGVCNVPTNNSNPPVPYTECNPGTGTGPNAVSLASFGAGGSVISSTAAVALLGVVLAGAAFLRRARR